MRQLAQCVPAYLSGEATSGPNLNPLSDLRQSKKLRAMSWQGSRWMRYDRTRPFLGSSETAGEEGDESVLH
jgi:hypothetical protein